MSKMYVYDCATKKRITQATMGDAYLICYCNIVAPDCF